MVFAESNDAVSDVVGVPNDISHVSQDSQLIEVESSQIDESILTESNNVINIHVTDSYNETSKTWDEKGFDLAGATVKVYDSSNKLVSTQKTNSNGIAVIKNLASKVYHLEVSYSTYEPKKIDNVDFTKNSGTIKIDNVMFIPDILLLVDYNSHNEKVDVLMNMSRR
ncbi:MAG: carboxypeptidase regulatory-like domain-containing protein, partial [Clostridia bacterium]|nr:carboxypeptidase regulatory-like domain-containing protein [Clostridia bacterium]